MCWLIISDFIVFGFALGSFNDSLQTITKFSNNKSTPSIDDTMKKSIKMSSRNSDDEDFYSQPKNKQDSFDWRFSKVKLISGLKIFRSFFKLYHCRKFSKKTEMKM
jgi:hypothetical protein